MGLGSRVWTVGCAAEQHSVGKIDSEHSQIDRFGDFPPGGPMFFIGLPAE
jgi:hypothetical protein